jgi:hypothetical protein
MGVSHQILNSLARRQLDGVLPGKFDHPCDGSSIGALSMGQSGQGTGQHFVNRPEVTAGELFADHLLYLRVEFHCHAFTIREKLRECKQETWKKVFPSQPWGKRL